MKRKLWKDRRCHHGNKPAWRLQYDFIDCGQPGCLEESLRRVGLMSIPKHEHRFVTDEDGCTWPCECGEVAPEPAQAGR